MTRTMADAIHVNVHSIPSGVPVVAGYVTGTPDIQWTPADWALFPGSELVTIDQGANGSPVPSAIVRDVETGAWTASAAVNDEPWTAARPTIYCNQSTLPAVLAAGWQGDLWLAIVGWQPGQPLPATPGCTVVAVQYATPGAYDLSYVLDAYWPLEAPVAGLIPGDWIAFTQYTATDGSGHRVGCGIGSDGGVWYTTSTDGGATWLDPVKV